MHTDVRRLGKPEKELALKALCQLGTIANAAFESLFEEACQKIGVLGYDFEIMQLFVAALRKIGKGSDMQFLAQKIVKEPRNGHMVMQIVDAFDDLTTRDLKHFELLLVQRNSNGTKTLALSVLHALGNSARPCATSVVQLLKHDHREVQDAAVKALQAMMVA